MMKQVKSAVLLRRSEPAAPPPLLSISQLPSLADSPGARRAWPAPQVIAVDCPSGLNCDSGELDQLAVSADMSVTFAGPKRRHFRFPGAAACGELVVADIGIADTLPEVAAVQLTLVTPQAVRNLLPRRPIDGHKGTFGTVLIAAGSAHYWGAPVLSGLGAYRSGAGLVALAVPEVIRATVAAQIREATFPPISAAQYLDAASAEFLLTNGIGAQSLLVGPGIGQADSFIEYLLSTKATLPPLVIDADGLNILATIPSWYEQLPTNSVLTPHPGEMARLLNLPVEQVKMADRAELARQAAQEWGHNVLLKGAYTVIASPTGDSALLPFANPLLAVAGSGDVLAGMIAAFLAQGLEPFQAAAVGGYLHGSAGELARSSYGKGGMLAGELANLVPAARKRIDEGV
jgi:ADP-dependent NAD(P)H-hydrate dehydratase / NAD(P)H-hydrate epimerase